MSYACVPWNVRQSWVVYWLTDSYMLILCGCVVAVSKHTLWATLGTPLSYIHVIERDAFIFERCIHSIYAYEFTMVLWFKTHDLWYTCFKQVTRNGIFDSSSVCFESMSWFTYLNGSFKYVIKRGQLGRWQHSIWL